MMINKNVKKFIQANRLLFDSHNLKKLRISTLYHIGILSLLFLSILIILLIGKAIENITGIPKGSATLILLIITIIGIVYTNELMEAWQKVQ